MTVNLYEQNRRRLGQRQVTDVISALCPNVQIVAFVDPNLTRWTSILVTQIVARHDYENRAVSRIACDKDADLLTKWAVDFLESLVGESCLISFNEYGVLPWLRISLPNKAAGLTELWNILKSKNICVMSCGGPLVRAIAEEEYEYLAFELSSDELERFAPRV